jgi:Conserved protein/domain typically associated with flavoprotein oxygenases, DIM6/NTAB family
MRKNFGAKHWLYPQPVLIIGTYDENGKADAMNAAWGGISEETEISICLDASHKTVSNFLKTGYFTVSMADDKHVAACDYIGIVSANDVPDKVERAGFHPVKAEMVNAPVFEELPMSLECKVISWDASHCRLVGEIVNVSADESILDDKGRIDVKKLSPITYDPIGTTYIKLGEKVGNAFKDGLSFK